MLRTSYSSAVLSFVLFALGCGAAVDAEAPDAPAVAGEPPIEAPRPRIVLQGQLPTASDRLLRPDGAIAVSSEDGVSFIDEATGSTIATAWTWAPKADAVLSADRRELLLLSRSPSLETVGATPPNGDPQMSRILARYDVEAQTRLWSVEIAPPVRPPDAGGYQETADHVTSSAEGIFVTRCFAGNSGACVVTEVRAKDGAIVAQTAVRGLPLDATSQERADTADGRFSLRRGEGPRSGPVLYLMYDARGRPAASFLARCARFDANGALLQEGAVPRTFSTVAPLDLVVREDPAACVAQPTVEPDLSPLDRTQGKVRITGDRMVWQANGQTDTSTLDLKAATLPSKSPLGRSLAGDSTGSAKPEGGLLWSSGPHLLYGTFAPPDDWSFVLQLAKAPNAEGGWVRLQGRTGFEPGFTVTDNVLTLAAGSYGLQRVDAKTGRMLLQRCTARKAGSNRCESERFIGLLVSPDGATAWTNHQLVKEGTATLEQIDLRTGETLQSVPLLRFHPEGMMSHRMQWIDPGKRLLLLSDGGWYVPGTTGLDITLPTAPGAPATYRPLSLEGRSLASEIDPAGRFIASFRKLDTVDIYATDGERVLTMAERNGAFFAQARGGRFACEGAACDALRCVVGAEVLPATAPACAPLRADGFSVLEELARYRQ